MKTFIVMVRDKFHLPYYYVINGCKHEHEAIKRAVDLYTDIGKPVAKVEIVKIISDTGHAVFSGHNSVENLLRDHL